jgi:hypothetical protein
MSVLSELEMRVLSELEEAGEDDVLTLLVTVMEPIGDANEVEQMCDALKNLVHADLVRMSIDREPTRRLRALPRDQSLAVIAELPANLRYDGQGRHWADIRHTGPPYGSPFPYVVDTDAGHAKAIEILTDRGYQWWRQKK